jgi:hypothetical protein
MSAARTTICVWTTANRKLRVAALQTGLCSLTASLGGKIISVLVRRWFALSLRFAAEPGSCLFPLRFELRES